MKNFEKRVARLEGNRCVAPDCDSKRRLARYRHYFEGTPWTCIDPEKRLKKESEALPRYRAFFEAL
jgi:hypothetical protein